jgi:predicted DNA-binding ribbon-helix-helix protein
VGLVPCASVDHRSWIEQGITVSALVHEIDGSRQQGNLSSAIRVFVFERLRAPA